MIPFGYVLTFLRQIILKWVAGTKEIILKEYGSMGLEGSA